MPKNCNCHNLLYIYSVIDDGRMTKQMNRTTVNMYNVCISKFINMKIKEQNNKGIAKTRYTSPMAKVVKITVQRTILAASKPNSPEQYSIYEW